MRKLHARLISISLALFGIVGAPGESVQAQVFDFWGRGPAEPHDERRRWRTLRTPPSVQDVAPPLPPRRPGLKFIDGKFVLEKSPGAAAWTPQKFQSPGQTARSKVRRRRKTLGRLQPKKPVNTGLARPKPRGRSAKLAAPKTPRKHDPNVWPKKTIEAAVKHCQAVIARTRAVAIAEVPIRKGPCGAPAPVRLLAFGGKQSVRFHPPVIVNCSLVDRLAKWLREDLQPLAKKHLRSRIKVVETMSSYACRNAYGRTSTRLSEHGLANAVDIRGFLTQSGKSVRLTTDWGETARDVRERIIAARKKAAEEAAARAKKAARAALRGSRSGLAVQGDGRKVGPAGGGPGERNGADKTSSPVPDSSVSKGKPVTRALQAKKIDTSDLKAIKAPRPKTNGGRFLRAAHRTACRLFGTVLGPEANEAHRDHFHVDLAKRKRSNYCR